jgi:hypothetical protein
MKFPEKNGQCVFLHEDLLGNSQELPAGQCGDERRDADHDGDGPQVGRGKDQLHALGKVPWLRFCRLLRAATQATDGGTPTAPDQDHQPGRNQYEQCHAQGQDFRAERLDGGLGEEAGKYPPCNAASAHHPEHALRLSRCQNVIRQGPDLGGCEYAENLHPNVEHRKQPRQTGVVMGQEPEQGAVAGEK